MSRQKNSQNYLFVRVIARGQRALLDVDRLLRHVGEGDLDRVLDAVQKLDDHAWRRQATSRCEPETSQKLD